MLTDIDLITTTSGTCGQIFDTASGSVHTACRKYRSGVMPTQEVRFANSGMVMVVATLRSSYLGLGALDQVPSKTPWIPHQLNDRRRA
jgi:hypothetical protein